MGIENPVHLIFIGVVALLVLGPKRLPELARALGHGLREFRDAVSQGGEVPHEPLAQQPQTPAAATAEQSPPAPAEPQGPPAP